MAGSTTTYAHTPGGPLAQKVGNTKRYYLRDMHGDLVGWSDTNGGLQGTALYDPWGELLSGTGEMATIPANGAFRFQGDLTESATGQVDTLTRMYEPTLGRFASRDVLFGEPTNVVSLNQYAYGADSPITYADPTGLAFEVGSGGDCDRKCTAQLNEAAEHAGDPQEDHGSPNTPAVDKPAADTFQELEFDWVQTRASKTVWSKYIIGQDFGTAFAAFIVGWDCEPPLCAPVNPGSIGVAVSARLGYRSPLRQTHTGFTLDVSLSVHLNRLNPESGYKLQNAGIAVLDEAGHKIQFIVINRNEVATTTGRRLDARLSFPTGSPQPRQVFAFASAFPNELNRAPVYTQARVSFNEAPQFIGPYVP